MIDLAASVGARMLVIDLEDVADTQAGVLRDNAEQLADHAGGRITLSLSPPPAGRDDAAATSSSLGRGCGLCVDIARHGSQWLPDRTMVAEILLPCSDVGFPENAHTVVSRCLGEDTVITLVGTPPGAVFDAAGAVQTLLDRGVATRS